MLLWIKKQRTNNLCEKCSFGFTGPGCTSQCMCPAYGGVCSEVCRCLIKFCDFAFGCNVSNQGGIGTTIIHQSKTIPQQTETKTTAVTQSSRRTTEKSLTHNIGMSSVSLVSYATAELIYVSTTMFLAYIAT